MKPETTEPWLLHRDKYMTVRAFLYGFALGAALIILIDRVMHV